MSRRTDEPTIKPYEAQKVLDAVNRFNETSKDDPNRETSANVALAALEIGVLTEEAAVSFNIDVDSLKANRNGKGLDLHPVTRRMLMGHISEKAIEHGAKQPKADEQPSDAIEDMGGFEPAYSS